MRPMATLRSSCGGAATTHCSVLLEPERLKRTHVATVACELGACGVNHGLLCSDLRRDYACRWAFIESKLTSVSQEVWLSHLFLRVV